MAQVLMPALSPTMTEGRLSRWLKKVGEDVRAGDVIAEIETDKATMEVEAVDEGTLSQILVEEGTDGVAVNTPIAVLSEEGAAAGNGAAPPAGEAARETAPPTSPEMAIPEPAESQTAIASQGTANRAPETAAPAAATLPT